MMMMPVLLFSIVLTYRSIQEHSHSTWFVLLCAAVLLVRCTPVGCGVGACMPCAAS
jgi:uncharacterized membrane protein YjdF